MQFDDDLIACAAMVEKADPPRFRSVMAAPVTARAVLFPLYAFNIEAARAPWVTQEPMIAEMRLQWWRDVCEEITAGGPVRRHEVATPLARAITGAQAQVLDTLVAARRWDIYKDAFEDQAHFDRYIDETAGGLMWVAASALGPAEERVVRDAGYGAGVANWLLAVPELEARGRVPLVDGTTEGVRSLARAALDRLTRARGNRAAVSRSARPALLAVGHADAVLRAAIADPRRVASGALPQPSAGGPGLAWSALTGRW